MSQPSLIELWEEHTRYEFSTRDTEAAIATMVDDAYVNHIPVALCSASIALVSMFTLVAAVTPTALKSLAA